MQVWTSNSKKRIKCEGVNRSAKKAKHNKSVRKATGGAAYIWQAGVATLQKDILALSNLNITNGC
jgi:hypothetical protein